MEGKCRYLVRTVHLITPHTVLQCDGGKDPEFRVQGPEVPEIQLTTNYPCNPSSRSTHVAADDIISFFFMAESYSIAGFLGGSVVKNLPVNVGDVGSILGLGRSPGVGNGHPSSILTWKGPWTEEPGGL